MPDITNNVAYVVTTETTGRIHFVARKGCQRALDYQYNSVLLSIEALISFWA